MVVPYRSILPQYTTALLRNVALITQALQIEGSLRGAARKLHMDPATLLRRKKKYQQAELIGADV